MKKKTRRLYRLISGTILFSLVGATAICMDGAKDVKLVTTRSPDEEKIKIAQGILIQQTAMAISSDNLSVENLEHNTAELIDRIMEKGMYWNNVYDVCKNATEKCSININSVSSIPVSDDENLVFLKIMNQN